MNKPILAPSLLSSNFADLTSAIKKIETQGGSWVHIDIMDGSFVPEITIGQPVIRSIRPLTTLPFDVHLMTEKPENQIESFAKVGADFLTFHYEATIHHHRIIEQIHSLGKKAGISIVPSTPISSIMPLLPFVDLILIMTVNPGFGGQTLITECLEKVKELAKIKKDKNFDYFISVDGGVNEKTADTIINSGVDVAVSGSAFFSDTLDLSKFKLTRQHNNSQ